MASIISVSLYIYIKSIWPQLVVDHKWGRTWRPPLGELRDAPRGGHCGETTEQEDSKPTFNITPHLSQHPNGILRPERLMLKEHRKQVRRCDSTQPWGSTQVCGSNKSRNEQVRPNIGKGIVCIGVVCFVWATGPENLPTVWLGTANTGRFGSRAVQQPHLLPLGRRNTNAYPSTCGFCRVGLDLSVPISGSAFRVSFFIVNIRYSNINCKIWH